MKYYIVAGEASGDLHGSNLMKSMKKSDSQADFRYFGGDLMEAQGGVLVCHYRKMAFMGLFDVIANLRTIASNLKFCKRDIVEYSPDALILIDYPGFNLKIAEFAHRRGVRVFYYISPKVWAWKKSRIKKLKAYVDKLFVIFPFEVEFFRQNDLEVEFFGNPLKDAIFEYRNMPENTNVGLDAGNDERPIVALLAGSRKSEVRICLPEMVKAASFFPEYRFIVAGASSLEHAVYDEILEGTGIEMVKNLTYPLLDRSFAAVVTSGTATLETALFNVPQVVVYKVGPFTYRLGRLFVNIRFFSLVNIIADKEVVKELLQHDLSEHINDELELLLKDNDYRDEMLSEYRKISLSLGENGVSDRLAVRMLELINNTG